MPVLIVECFSKQLIGFEIYDRATCINLLIGLSSLKLNTVSWPISLNDKIHKKINLVKKYFNNLSTSEIVPQKKETKSIQ
jgi:hypothetical protein